MTGPLNVYSRPVTRVHHSQSGLQVRGAVIRVSASTGSCICYPQTIKKRNRSAAGTKHVSDTVGSASSKSSIGWVR